MPTPRMPRSVTRPMLHDRPRQVALGYGGSQRRHLAGKRRCLRYVGVPDAHGALGLLTTRPNPTNNTSDVPSMYEHFGSYGNLRLRERPGAMRRAGGNELEREAAIYNKKKKLMQGNSVGYASPNGRNNSNSSNGSINSPSMQNPFQF